MTRQRILIGLAGLYIIVAVGTFGHAGAQASKRYDREYAQCLAALQPGVTTICINRNMAGLDAFVASLFWPFYWSWELQA